MPDQRSGKPRRFTAGTLTQAYLNYLIIVVINAIFTIVLKFLSNILVGKASGIVAVEQHFFQSNRNHF